MEDEILDLLYKTGLDSQFQRLVDVETGKIEAEITEPQPEERPKLSGR